MKKVLLTAAALLLIAVAANASPGYVGLFADANHSDCDLYLSGGFMPFELWIWFFTPELGVQAAEYRVTVPAYVIPSVTTTNPAITASLGDALAGISVAFGACQTGWIWTQHMSCYLTGAGPGYITIGPRPSVGLQFSSCEVGYPIYPATVLNQLAIGQTCEVATENASWGAIKSLF